MAVFACWNVKIRKFLYQKHHIYDLYGIFAVENEQNRVIMPGTPSQDSQKGIKVIHVHFITGRRNFYFGSVRAVYKKFTADEIGCSENQLRRVLSHDGAAYCSSKVLAVRSRLIR